MGNNDITTITVSRRFRDWVAQQGQYGDSLEMILHRLTGFEVVDGGEIAH